MTVLLTSLAILCIGLAIVVVIYGFTVIRQVKKETLDRAKREELERGYARQRELRLRRSEAAKKGHATRTHNRAVNDRLVAADLELHG